jgi:hypothetical protein
VSDKTKAEVINQTHPFIQYICSKLREIDEAFMPLVSLVISKEHVPPLALGTYVAVIKRISFVGIRIEEKLLARVKLIECEKLLDPDLSMDIVNTIRLKAKDWPEATQELISTNIEEQFDLCEELIEQDYNYDALQKNAENKDRISLQIESAKTHFKRQLESSQSALQKHQNAGRSSLIKATEGRIRKISERFEQREAELKVQEQFSHRIDDVCHVVLKVI